MDVMTIGIFHVHIVLSIIISATSVAVMSADADTEVIVDILIISVVSVTSTMDDYGMVANIIIDTVIFIFGRTN